MPTPPTAITPLPTPPDPANRATFNARAYPWSVAQGQLAAEIASVASNVYANAQEAAAFAASAVNAPGTSATSTTSMAIGTGSKTLTIQTGKAFSVGQFVVVAATASPTNYMIGQITAHNSGTGSITVGVASTGGGGTYAGWTVSLIGAGMSLEPSFTSINGGGLSGFRNRVINGDFSVWQRANFSIGSYTADRWLAYSAGVNCNISQVSFNGLAPHTYCDTGIQISGVSGNTATTLSQRIKSSNIKDMIGKPVIAQAWVFSSNDRNVTIGLDRATIRDVWSAGSVQIATQVHALTAGWNLVSVKTTLTADAGLGVALSIYLGAVTSGQTVYVTAVQFQAGAITNAFEPRPHAIELILCKHYYQEITLWGRGYAPAIGAAITCYVALPVQMRANPTIGVFLPTYSNCGNVTIQFGSDNTMVFSAFSTAIGDAYWYTAANGVWLSAEL